MIWLKQLSYLYEINGQYNLTGCQFNSINFNILYIGVDLYVTNAQRTVYIGAVNTETQGCIKQLTDTTQITSVY